MNVLLQQERMGRLTTPLGPDALVLTRFEGEEALGELFAFRVEATSTQADIDFDAALGRHCCVTLERHGGTQRHFNGLLTEAAWVGRRQDLHLYRLTLRPWLWCLSQASDCRIFKGQSVPQILRAVFAGRGFGDVRLALVEDYPALEYCVQYRETDLAFVCRLMEEVGIAYHFEHEATRHTLVLADAPSSYTPAPNLPRVPFRPTAPEHDRRGEYLSDWHAERRLRTGAVRLKDYDFVLPDKDLKAEREAGARYAHGDLMRYDYPGRYTERDDGERLARVRLEALQAEDGRRQAAGDAANLYPGATVTLERHQQASENRSWLVLRARHGFEGQAYRSGEDAGGKPYVGTYELIDAARPYRMPQTTEKPRIHGSQTARVVVAEGEEIDVDRHGRVEVWFHWDLERRYSRRVRVAQLWSSKTWGGQFIPRKDQEVVVSYLEGDPDQPLVVGTVYNGANQSAYELPAHKTRMVIRSDTHKGQGFNEITFEDDNGRQNLFTHAQRDRTTRVLHDHTERVDRHQVSSVGKNQALEVGGNVKQEVGGSMNLTVGGTGAGALALMGAVAGLAPVTAGLLSQAGAIAGGGGAALGGFAGTLASSALGFLGGGGLGAREGVVSGPSPRPDAGTALAGSGTGVGEAAGGLFPFGGIMNTVVGSFQSTSVGVAQVDQIGVAKVTNVGATSLESVGKFKKIAVGEEFVIEVGDSKFIMKSNGEVIILGKTFNFIATDHVQIKGKPIDLN